jgi:hypothetical protein
MGVTNRRYPKAQTGGATIMIASGRETSVPFAKKKDITTGLSTLL